MDPQRRSVLGFSMATLANVIVRQKKITRKRYTGILYAILRYIGELPKRNSAQRRNELNQETFRAKGLLSPRYYTVSCLTALPTTPYPALTRRRRGVTRTPLSPPQTSKANTPFGEAAGTNNPETVLPLHMSPIFFIFVYTIGNTKQKRKGGVQVTSRTSYLILLMFEWKDKEEITLIGGNHADSATDSGVRNITQSITLRRES